jgi:phage FluMu protein Com
MDKRVVKCPKCSKLMRVDSIPEVHEVACPQCNKVLKVPGVKPKEEVPTGWKMRSLDGQIFGPYSEAEIGQFVAEQRVLATSELNHPTITGATWKKAEYLPQFHRLFLEQKRPSVDTTNEVKSPKIRPSKTENVPQLSFETDKLNSGLSKVWSGIPFRPKVVIAVLGVIFLALTVASEVALAIAWVSSPREATEVGMSWIHFFTMPIFCFVVVVVISIYTMPTIVAFLREHQNVIPVMIVNICFGWTFLGWALALVWSFTANQKAVFPPPPTHIHTHVYTHGAPGDSSASVS